MQAADDELSADATLLLSLSAIAVGVTAKSASTSSNRSSEASMKALCERISAFELSFFACLTPHSRSSLWQKLAD